MDFFFWWGGGRVANTLITPSLYTAFICWINALQLVCTRAIVVLHNIVIIWYVHYTKYVRKIIYTIQIILVISAIISAIILYLNRVM